MYPVLVNGSPRDTISVWDRGLQYGDGIFETLAVVDSKPRLWYLHIKRLLLGCQRLSIPCIDAEQLLSEVITFLEGRACGVLKILITRGAGGRGYSPPKAAQPTRILSFHPKPDHPPEWWSMGVRVCLCRTPLGINPALAGIKHTNRLEQVLARSEWDTPDIAEGLMRDSAGNWISGTKTNLFLAQVDELLTPDINNCGVSGIMRGLVIKQAQRSGLKVTVRPIGTSDLERAKGIYLTNSLIGMWPVRELSGRVYDPNAIHQSLRAAWLHQTAY